VDPFGEECLSLVEPPSAKGGPFRRILVEGIGEECRKDSCDLKAVELIEAAGLSIQLTGSLKSDRCGDHFVFQFQFLFLTKEQEDKGKRKKRRD